MMKIIGVVVFVGISSLLIAPAQSQASRRCDIQGATFRITDPSCRVLGPLAWKVESDDGVTRTTCRCLLLRIKECVTCKYRTTTTQAPATTTTEEPTTTTTEAATTTTEAATTTTQGSDPEEPASTTPGADPEDPTTSGTEPATEEPTTQPPAGTDAPVETTEQPTRPPPETTVVPEEPPVDDSTPQA